MGYENDPYRDDEGEPLVDFDEDVQSEGDQPHQHLLDDDVYDRGERSPTPVYDDSSSKPRKRLIKKSSVKESGPLDFGLDDDDVGDVGGDYDRDDDVAGLVRDDYSDDGKRKRDNGEKARSLEKKRKAEKGEKKFKVRKSGGGRMKDHEADPEMKEMWDTIAGDNSEDDQEGVRTLDDDNFIDDTGVDPSDRYGSGNEHSPS